MRQNIFQRRGVIESKVKKDSLSGRRQWPRARGVRRPRRKVRRAGHQSGIFEKKLPKDRFQRESYRGCGHPVPFANFPSKTYEKHRFLMVWALRHSSGACPGFGGTVFVPPEPIFGLQGALRVSFWVHFWTNFMLGANYFRPRPQHLDFVLRIFISWGFFFLSLHLSFDLSCFLWVFLQALLSFEAPLTITIPQNTNAMDKNKALEMIHKLDFVCGFNKNKALDIRGRLQNRFAQSNLTYIDHLNIYNMA